MPHRYGIFRDQQRGRYTRFLRVLWIPKLGIDDDIRPCPEIIRDNGRFDLGLFRLLVEEVFRHHLAPSGGLDVSPADDTVCMSNAAMASVGSPRIDELGGIAEICQNCRRLVGKKLARVLAKPTPHRYNTVTGRLIVRCPRNAALFRHSDTKATQTVHAHL